MCLYNYMQLQVQQLFYIRTTYRPTSHISGLPTLTFTIALREEREGADGHGVDGSADNATIFSSLCSPLSCVFSSCTSWNSLSCSD